MRIPAGKIMFCLTKSIHEANLVSSQCMNEWLSTVIKHTVIRDHYVVVMARFKHVTTIMARIAHPPNKGTTFGHFTCGSMQYHIKPILAQYTPHGLVVITHFCGMNKEG
ncbi:hypothetical protein D3C80_1201890 [compost metagenome]